MNATSKLREVQLMKGPEGEAAPHEFGPFKPRDPHVRVRQRTVEEDWLPFEEERGPAGCMDEEDLSRTLETIASRCSVRGEPVLMPRAAALRVIEKILDECGRNRNVSPADRSVIAQRTPTPRTREAPST